MTTYSCQCGRCGGTGKYDRGTCFECKGVGYRNVSRKPTLPAHSITVTYSNGSVNNVVIYASRKEITVSIVERQLRIKGWNGVVE